MPNNCRVNPKQCAPRRNAAAEKVVVVVNLLRKSGKKSGHFNEWTGTPPAEEKSMEEITSGRRGTFNNIRTAEFG